MDILQIIALGIVQAVTEWLPLSSKTMDTLLFTRVFGGSLESVVPLLLFLHIGTLCAAAIYFRREIAGVAREFFSAPLDIERHKKGKVGFLATAILFTGIVGVPILIIEKFLLPSLSMDLLLSLMGAGLILTGFMLTTHKKDRWRATEAASWKDGVLTGALQGLSTIPGVSRAGCSTTGLIWRGFDAESAFHLSFLLSIPTVFIAEMVVWGAQMLLGSTVPAMPLADGLALAASSFVFGYITIDVLLKIAHKINVASLAFIFGIMMLIFGLIGIG
ncbi:MAG: undecaprenyl-diphosphate phosphatase [Candidatus Micrarchaeota archaeon]|nr:undecaprenyl-diphosphate phosphatase [Candidatus Micrarchaeota archaeon]